MNRRDFLKTSGLMFLTLMVQFNPIHSLSKNLPVEITANGLTLRGTPAGEIYTSHDGGVTWQLHTRLGCEYAITGLFLDGSQRIHARVAFGGRSFELALAKDNKYWITI
jgi:hypothetical protein